MKLARGNRMHDQRVGRIGALGQIRAVQGTAVDRSDVLRNLVAARLAGANVEKLRKLQRELDELPSGEATPAKLLDIASRMDAVNGGNTAQLVIDKLHELHGDSKLRELRDETSAELRKVERKKADLETRRAALGDEFTAVAGFSFDDWRASVVKAAREVPVVPLTSANNVEVTVMGVAHVWGAVRSKLDFAPDQLAESLTMWATEEPVVARQREIGSKALAMVSGGDEALLHEVSLFASRWRESSYAKLEIGHKLAASLCLTDVPEDIEINMPWPAWSLIVPDGLLGDLARIWVLDADDFSGVRRQACILVDRHGRHPGKITAAESELIRSLVMGAALALSNPDEFRKERHHKPSARSTKRRETGAPDFSCARFLLSTPVTVDLREHVHAAIEDARAGRRRGSHPKVQFLVRGHWRNQAHGAGHQLRRRQWIRPFWKGPEETRVLLRTHMVKQ